jgi:hypothetical protein
LSEGFICSDDVKRSLATFLKARRATAVTAAAVEHRKVGILDCCYSGAAVREWQGPVAEKAADSFVKAMPQRGVILLCSSAEATPRRSYGQSLATQLAQL